MQTWQLLQAFRSELRQQHSRLRILDKRLTLPPRCVRASQCRAYSSREESKNIPETTSEPVGEDRDDLRAGNGFAAAIAKASHAKKENGKARWRARQRVMKQELLLKDLLDVKEDVASAKDTTEAIPTQVPDNATTAPPVPDRAILTSHQSVSSALPMPSFLRPTLQDRLRANLLAKYPQKKRRSGSHSNPHGQTVKKSLSAAPFSTAFSQNPYAHALASPVREDSLSRVHLPMSCLLDFHIAELDPEAVQPDNDTKKAGKGSGKDDTVQYSLLPLSLATELTQKTEQPRNSSQHEGKRVEQVITATQRVEARSPRPTGSSSYLTSTYDALKFISEDPKRRLASNALSRRMHATIGMTRNMQPAHIQWMPEMPDMVQSALRRIVVKKLGYLLRSKGARDKPGLICEVAGGGQTLQGLGRMEDVSCVVQLSGEADDESRVGGTSSAQQWRDYPFLNHVAALSAQSPATARTSTLSMIQYRNIKVPMYSLPALLGEEMAEKVVAGTVFAAGGRTGTEQEVSEEGGTILRKPTRYVVLTRSNGTLQAQMWLLKLQSFLGGSNSRPTK